MHAQAHTGFFEDRYDAGSYFCNRFWRCLLCELCAALQRLCKLLTPYISFEFLEHELI
jgi:hypothetical protein